jgi:hypothetical protein
MMLLFSSLWLLFKEIFPPNKSCLEYTFLHHPTKNFKKEYALMILFFHESLGKIKLLRDSEG